MCSSQKEVRAIIGLWVDENWNVLYADLIVSINIPHD